MAADARTYISERLRDTKFLPVSETWLTQFLSNQRPGATPLPALTQTALFHLLASDFTRSLAIPASRSNQLLPVDISNPNIKERCIPGPIPCQILDIEDIGASAWSQVEAIERIERGETIRGREVIRTVPQDAQADEGNGTNNAAGNGGQATNSANPSAGTEQKRTGGPHRLVLQDAQGTKMIAIEFRPLSPISIAETAIGAKLLISNAIVARGMALLEPASVTMLGGKIDALDRAWRAGRKDKLLSILNPPANTD